MIGHGSAPYRRLAVVLLRPAGRSLHRPARRAELCRFRAGRRARGTPRWVGARPGASISAALQRDSGPGSGLGAVVESADVGDAAVSEGEHLPSLGWSALFFGCRGSGDGETY